MENRKENFGLHHSFDVDLAVELRSVDLAILVQHFQYWIRHNTEMGVNFHENRTWTFQTHKEISVTFPYWSTDQVKRMINKLVELKILLKGNFNTNPYDHTVWYAFNEEQRFSISRNRQIDMAKSPYRTDEIAKSRSGEIAISNKDIKQIYNQNTISPNPSSPAKAAEPQAAKAAEKKRVTSEYTDEVKELAKSVIAAMVAAKPDYAVPRNLTPLMTSLDFMLRLDKRDPQKILDVLRWALADPFWRDKMFKANVAEYLRKDNRLDALDEKMRAKNINPNRVDRRTRNQDGTPVDAPHLENLF